MVTRHIRIHEVSSAEPHDPLRLSDTNVSLFKSGMRRLASGVTVVTTAHENKQYGLVSTGLTSVSAEPPVLLICINQAATSHDPIARSGRFCVNVLRAGDEALAKRFGDPAQRSKRFLSREWQTLATGAPALVGSLASFDCIVTRALAADSHTVFFGRVADVRLWSEEVDPLLYWDGAYRQPE
ncbi:flavin-dependent monooxygenase, reductase subunit HsaB [Variibacter gotjawalensis]|uniref:Flavin-dependent monooxygenase, reductase subunit HsaB n=1 Tax=Variibacter gotjawalensis TaxID=1333996 RepID=A0A0S3Q167_9BRAD|nr:flavin reductase family protein [Variibacter gotjawalensis]RZS49641.1 flavin reductase [Variibacter gotjawalensis]BAT61905.1 flavin-dependent monooxygenase, reductase subunit HsaB [Variibacter gotjawalensis]